MSGDWHYSSVYAFPPPSITYLPVRQSVMFKVSPTIWVNLSLVTRISIQPPMEWSTEPDENCPRLVVRLVGNDYVEVLEREAVEGGFEGTADLQTKLIAALDAFAAN